MQAAQLRVEEVEAEHARPRRAQEVLPLVRPAHGAPGDEVVARQTRAERRARREARERSMAGSPAPDGTATARQPALQPAPAPTPAQAGHRRRQGNWVFNFIRESIGELRKVEWPTQ